MIPMKIVENGISNIFHMKFYSVFLPAIVRTVASCSYGGQPFFSKIRFIGFQGHSPTRKGDHLSPPDVARLMFEPVFKEM